MQKNDDSYEGKWTILASLQDFLTCILVYT